MKPTISIYWIPVFLGTLLFLGSTASLYADEPDSLMYSTRALGMGNAHTAVANDEMLFFYNPAGLRSLTHNLYQIPISPQFTMNQELLDLMCGNISAIASLCDFLGGSTVEQDAIAGLGDITGRKIYLNIGDVLFSHHNSRWGFNIFGNFLILS